MLERLRRLRIVERWLRRFNVNEISDRSIRICRLVAICWCGLAIYLSDEAGRRTKADNLLRPLAIGLLLALAIAHPWLTKINLKYASVGSRQFGIVDVLIFTAIIAVFLWIGITIRNVPTR